MQGPWGTWQRGQGPSQLCPQPAGKRNISVLYNSLLRLQEIKTIDWSGSRCPESKGAEGELGTQRKGQLIHSLICCWNQENCKDHPAVTGEGIRMGREQHFRSTLFYVHQLTPLSPAPAVLLGTLSKGVLQDPAVQLGPQPGH